MAAAIYAGLAAVFLTFLSIRVIGLRRDRKVSIGDGDDPEIARAMRVQANFVEYTPIALILLVLIELQQAPFWLVHAFGAAFLAFRLMHFLGFRSAEAPGVYRVYGMLGTFGMLWAMGAVAIVQALAF